MATFYTTWSSGDDVGGGQALRHFRGYCTYSTSTSATAVTISAVGGIQLDHSGTYKTFTGTVYVGSYSSSSTWNASYGGATSKQTSSVSHTYTRTTSAYTVTVSVTASYSGSTSAFKKSSPRSNSVSISVPALAKYTVTFNANGHGLAPTSQSIFYGYKATKPSDPVERYYNFEGWYTDQACTSPFDFNSTITSNKILYAKWVKATPTIRAKIDGSIVTGEFYIKTSDAISLVSEAYIKSDGVWKQIE